MDANIATNAAIAGSKISFANDAISGDKIHSGTITDFASTGIDDNATSLAMTITSGGNIGIGTTSPSNTLTVSGNADFTSNVGIRNSEPIYPLDITGYVRISDSFSTNLMLRSTGTNGRQYHLMTTDNGSSFGGGKFIIFDNDAPAARITINSNGNVGIGTTSPDAKLKVQGGRIVASQYSVTGSTVDFNNGNVQILSSVGGSAITLNNMIDGGAYTLIIADTTSRTYTFPNCTNARYLPKNGATTSGKHSIYTILKTTISSSVNCYITWLSGF